MPTPAGHSAQRYDALIAYPSGPDEAIAERLQSALESYNVPHSLVAHGAPRRLKGVTLAKGELTPGGELSPDDLEVLAQARFLIVVCSPRTPASARVLRQIEAFRSLGRGDRILTLLAEGDPEESFPRLLREERRSTVTDAAGRQREIVEVAEPLAADIRARTPGASLRLLKLERLRLIAPIIGFTFDDLKQRRRERLVRYWSIVGGVAIAAAAVFGGVSFYQWQEAVRQTRIARQQQQMAQEARERLFKQLPERFKDVPGALPVIEQVLKENEAEVQRLETESDPMQYIDKLLERQPSLELDAPQAGE